MSVTETPKRKLSLKREVVASFLPEGSKAVPAKGRVQLRPTPGTDDPYTTSTNEGSGTFCTCC